MVNAIPTANTNLAGFGFGAMRASRLRYRWYQYLSQYQPAGFLEGRIGRDV
jgi:hypothetical protein